MPKIIWSVNEKEPLPEAGQCFYTAWGCEIFIRIPDYRGKEMFRGLDHEHIYAIDLLTGEPQAFDLNKESIYSIEVEVNVLR